MESQPDQSPKDQTEIGGNQPVTKRRTYTKVFLLVVGLLITLFGLMLSQVRYHGFDIWGALSMGVGLIILIPGLLGLLYSYVRSRYRKATNSTDSRGQRQRLAYLVVFLGVALGYCVGAWLSGGWDPSEVNIFGGLSCGFITFLIVLAEIKGTESRASPRP